MDPTEPKERVSHGAQLDYLEEVLPAPSEKRLRIASYSLRHSMARPNVGGVYGRFGFERGAVVG
jgi:hypothetical protein